MVRGESRDLHADAGPQRELAEILVGIRKAIKTFLFYRGGHPARARALEDTHEQITRLLNQWGPLSLRTGRDGFSYAERPVGKDHPRLQGFALELFVRGIQTVRFLPGVRLEDLQHLTDLLTLEAADLSRQGGARAYLRHRGVLTIEVEELDLKFTERASHQPESTLDRESPAPGAFAETAPPAPSDLTHPEADALAEGRVEGGEATARGAEEEEVEPDLEALIAELQETDRPARYEYLTGELSQWGFKAFARGEVETCLRIMVTLALQLHPMSPKEQTLTQYARAALNALLEKTDPQHLIDGFCRRGTVSEDDLVHLLLTLKEDMAGPMVHQLLIEEEAAVRRKLADLLSRMGSASVPAVKSALQAPSWEAVRLLLPLLPRPPVPEVAEILKGLLGHSDPRIRRESIRPFGQMDAALAGEALLSALGDSETSVRQAAIAALGGLKVKAAVPFLRQIAEERSGTRGLEEQKRAITALGAIGDPEGLPTLIGLLHRRRWFFRRATEELRLAAAYALGALGGPDATQALRAVAKSAGPGLKRACEMALSRTHLPSETEEA